MRKLNTTGSYWIDNEGNLWSYSTQMTTIYKGQRIFNDSYFSMTTRKHQADMRNFYHYDLVVTRCDSLASIEYELEREIRNTQYELDLLENKRNTKKKLATIEELKQHIKTIQELLAA